MARTPRAALGFNSRIGTKTASFATVDPAYNAAMLAKALAKFEVIPPTTILLVLGGVALAAVVVLLIVKLTKK